MQLDIFRIPVQGSSIEVQDYDFKIDDSFFAHFEYGEIERGDLLVKIKVLYTSLQIKLDLSIHGEVEIVCDRCLDIYKEKLDSNYILYGKFGHGANQEDIDVFWIPEDKHYIDLLPVFFDYINLSLPLKNIHPEDEEGNSLCNSEMISRLDALDINREEDFE
jgi:uncharacterized protein